MYHVSYSEFEKQYVELSDWCERISQSIKQISTNALTCYLRQVGSSTKASVWRELSSSQTYYEELYEQGLGRLRLFNQYADRLIERFSDIRMLIEEKLQMISRLWDQLEARFLDYLDEDFDRLIHGKSYQ